MNLKLTVPTAPNHLPKGCGLLRLPEFGNTLSLEAARRIIEIDSCIHAYSAKERRAGKESWYYIDIWIIKPNGDTHIIRSNNLKTAKNFRAAYTKTVAKIAMFLFENKDVVLPQLAQQAA